MKKILFTLAALAMIMVSCTQDNLETEQEDNRTFIVSAAMPETDNDAQTRVSLTPDAESGTYGLRLEWETDDKLMFCFEKDGTYYHNDALIVPSSISDDGKTAQFTITIPTEIPANGTFNLYGVYQKTNTWTPTNGGYFIEGTKLYELESNEHDCITLDKEGFSGLGKARPVLYFSQVNIENSTEPAFAPFNLEHSGWMIALHFKNSSGAEIDFPKRISLESKQDEKWVWNGFTYKRVQFDLADQLFSLRDGKLEEYGLTFRINDKTMNWLPLTNKTLADGASIVFYRWVASISEVPELKAEIHFVGTTVKTPTTISNKTVSNGKMHHVYTEWDGTNFEFVPAY